MPWHLPWLRLHLVTRALLAIPITPEVKQALVRCAELRRILLHDRSFN
jgi:hypothetical protein